METIKNILLYIWQLPQNILGLLFLLFLKGEKKHKLYGITFYVAKGFSGGISLGKYIIMGFMTEKKIRHEYGHCVQSKWLGPLYLIIIGLPSICWVGIHRLKCVAERWEYWEFYTESWADKIAGVKRKK